MGTLYASDFESDEVGALPAGWVVTKGTWAVSVANPASGQKGFGSTSGGNGDFAVYTGAPAQIYQRITIPQKMAVTPSGTTTNIYYIGLRCGANGASGYLIGLETSGLGQLTPAFYKITSLNGYGFRVGGTPINGIAAGDILIKELTIDASNKIELRVWKSTGTRPTDATFTYQTAGEFASGHIALYQSRSTTSTFATVDDMLYESAETPVQFSGTVAAQTINTGMPFSLGLSSYFNGSLQPFSYSIASGSLPAGLSLNASTGIISGTTSATGTYSVTVRATDTASNIATTGTITLNVVVANMFSVADPAIYWSPYNWYSDGSGAMQANNVKAGSALAWASMRGAYLKFRATVGANGFITLNIDTSTLSAISAEGCPQIAWSIGNGAWQSKLLVAGDSTLSLATGLSAGTYEVFIYYRGAYLTRDGFAAQMWTTPNNRFHITSLVMSTGATISATTIRSKKMAAFGDSITEGDLSAGYPRGSGTQDSAYTYGWFLAQALDAEIGIIGFYGNQWSWLNSTWSSHAQGISRLVGGQFAPAPDYITVNYGENDANNPPSTATISATWAAIAAAAPSARLIAIVPFSGACRANLTAATLPAGAIRVDLARPEMLSGTKIWSFDGQHPNLRGAANLGALLAYAINNASPNLASRTVSVTLTTDGTTPAAGLTGLVCRWFDSPNPTSNAAPTTVVTGAGTNASGVLTISVNTTLPSGGVGTLIVTDSDGTVQMQHKAFIGPAAVA